MAISRPACTAWYSMTLLSTGRALGVRPKDTLLTPSEHSTPGKAALICRMPSMVSIAELPNSGSPVARVKVRVSKTRSCGRRPCSFTAMS